MMIGNGRPVLVTGASGFIGRHLTERLLAEGCDVAVLVRSSSRLSAPIERAARRLNLDDWAGEPLQRLLRNVDFGMLFHLASYGVAPDQRQLSEMMKINVELPLDLVRLAAEQGAAVTMAGSCSEYAAPVGDQLLGENAPLETGKLYGSFKAASGIVASSVARELKVPFALLRLFNVYGPGEAAHRLLPSLLRRLLADEFVPLSPGGQVRDFVYVDDVVDALLVAAERVEVDRSVPNIFNVATGTGNTVRHYCEIVAGLLGKSPHLLGFGEIGMRPDEVMFMVGDPTRMCYQLAWRAKFDLASGLRRALMASSALVGGDAY